eukprot:RCo030721
MAGNNLYMVSMMARRRSRRWDFLQTVLPYAAIGLLLVVLFIGVDSLNKDRVAAASTVGTIPEEAPDADFRRDWTHKLSLRKDDDDARPDDENIAQCPTPLGNWANTCRKVVVIEGPCNGKCLLKAVCEDLRFKFKDTTFEYNEGTTVEIKNVNGLLCKLDTDGAPICGVNFHGNIASKNCLGYVPRRHETNPTGAPEGDTEGESEEGDFPKTNPRKESPLGYDTDPVEDEEPRERDRD